MPEMGWQLVVCGLIVAWAVIVLVRGVVQLLRGRSGGCHAGSCGDCPADGLAASETSGGFVPLNALELPVGDERRS